MCNILHLDEEHHIQWLKKAAGALLIKALEGFIHHVTYFCVNATDKIGFDLDVIGRGRETSRIAEDVRVTYNNNNIPNVNIAIWNMQLDEEHHFDLILASGVQLMGNGGGFIVVFFTGSGWIENKRARRFDNWHCSGLQSRRDNIILCTALIKTGAQNL